jgi:Nucleotidyltransferase domain
MAAVDERGSSHPTTCSCSEAFRAADIFPTPPSNYKHGMSPEETNQIVATFRKWGNAQASLRALAIVGSWARGAARPDSDLDLLALTNDMVWATSVERLRDPA